jgi:hypothetical protein
VSASSAPAISTTLDPATFPVPTPTELGLRIRKIINALTRYNMKQNMALSISKDKEVEQMERKRLLKEKQRLEKLEKIKAKESDLSKKSKSGERAHINLNYCRFSKGDFNVWCGKNS